MNDGVLVEALRARDPGALAALYDTYAANLYQYCRTLLAGPDAAQVALRDTLIAAEALIGSLADPGRLRPWLYALARGECMRRRTPGEEDGPDSGPVPVATVPFPGLAADRAEADLRLVASSAVGALSVEDREVLELVARHEMTGQDLAAVLGAGERYVVALLNAATERLAETVTAEIVARHADHDCERVSAILAGFTGELTPQLRTQLIRHLARCETCARQRVRQISPAKVFGLLPQVALPETLRVRVLSSFIDPELVPYRRYVAKRVGRLNAAGFPTAGRREGKVAQAVAGAVAALAAVATIALVFAQFAGDLRERAADTIAPLRLPPAEASAGPSESAASPEGTKDDEEGPDEADEAAKSPPAPPVSRDVAAPVAPVLTTRPVALPRPAPLPAPVPPAGRPHHRPPHTKPTVRPTGSAFPQDPGSPSGPTPLPPTTPGTEPGEAPSTGGSGSGRPGSGHPGSGRPHWGGPPPAHWPGHRPPWRDHQHHSHPHRGWPPRHWPPHRDHDWPSAGPPWRGGHGSHEHGKQEHGRPEHRGGGHGGRPQGVPAWRGQEAHRTGSGTSAHGTRSGARTQGTGSGVSAHGTGSGAKAHGTGSGRWPQRGSAGGSSRSVRPGGFDHDRPRRTGTGHEGSAAKGTGRGATGKDDSHASRPVRPGRDGSTAGAPTGSGERHSVPAPGRPGRDDSAPGVPAGTRDGGSERGTDRRAATGISAAGGPKNPGGQTAPGDRKAA